MILKRVLRLISSRHASMVALWCSLMIVLIGKQVFPRGHGDPRIVISVIVPCYNVNPQWLKTTLDSINGQTVAASLEVILIDDGSIQVLGAQGVKIHEMSNVASLRVHRHWVNRGLSAARNTGATLARGRYLIFLDPDDFMDLTALEKMLTLLQGFEVISNSQVRYVYPAVVHFKDDPKRPMSIESNRYDQRQLVNNNFIPSFALISRELYLRTGGMCESNVCYFEDYDFWLRLASLGIHGRLLDEPLLFYRRHGSGRSHVIRSKGLDWMSELRDNNPIAFGNGFRGQDLELGEPPTWDALGPCHRPLPRYGSLLCLWLWRRGLWRGTYQSPPPLMDLKDDVSLIRCDVVLIVPWLEVGGADYYDLDFIKTLLSMHLKPAIIVDVVDRHGGDRLKGNFRSLLSDITHLATLLPPAHSQEDIDRLLLKLYIRRKPKVLYIRNSMNGYRLARRLKLMKEPVSIWDIQHLTSPGDALGWEYTTIRYADYLDHRIVVSHHLKLQVMQRLEEAGILHSFNLHVIPPSVDITDPAFAQSTLSASCPHPEYKTVIFVGRMQEQKDPRLWVRVAVNLAEHDSQLLFLMIGEGYLLDSVKQQVSATSSLTNRLLFLPFLERTKLASVLRAGLYKDGRGVLRLHQEPDACPDHAMLLVTSENEGLPYVILESMALGLKVVTPHVGAVEEIAAVAPDRIRIVHERSVEALARAVLSSFLRVPAARHFPINYTFETFQKKFRALLNQFTF